MASHSPPLDALVVPSEDYYQVPLSLFLFQFFTSKHFASSNLEILNLMEYRNLFIYLYKNHASIHLAVQNLNLSSFMLFLLILNLKFGIIFFSSTQFNMHSISMLLIII